MADAGRADHDRHEWEVFENLSQNGVAKCVHHYDVFKNTPTGVGDLYGAFKAAIEFVDINGDGKHDAIIVGAGWGSANESVEGIWFTNPVGKMSVYLGNSDLTFTYSKES